MMMTMLHPACNNDSSSPQGTQNTHSDGPQWITGFSGCALSFDISNLESRSSSTSPTTLLHASHEVKNVQVQFGRILKISENEHMQY
jgi:hypothetical protein